MRREQGFGVELQAVERERAVAQGHELGRRTSGVRQGQQRGRQRLADNERVVARNGLLGGQASENWVGRSAAHGGDFAVHGPGGAHHGRPKKLAQRLVAQAHAQHGHGLVVGGDEGRHHAGGGGRAGAGREHHAIVFGHAQVGQRYVVAAHGYFGPQLAQVVG